jgi:hypothetical protein
MNWRGRPLVSHEVILELIAATRTRSGLRVHAELDLGRYPMPAQQCLRRHESMEPMLRWEQAGQRREDGPVWPGGAWSADLSAQDRDLVGQDEDLGVLGCLRPGQQSEPAKSWEKIR